MSKGGRARAGPSVVQEGNLGSDLLEHLGARPERVTPERAARIEKRFSVQTDIAFREAARRTRTIGPERERLVEAIVERRLAGWTLEEIAYEFGYSISQVSRILKANAHLLL